MKNIPEDLSNKIKSFLQTPANNADPKMSLTVVRAKDTVMDNTYWTTEVIRTKEGLGDLSVATRRLKPYGSPDSIYNIYIDNEVVKTAIREYPDVNHEGWVDQFELGSGIACAITFDGYWELYKGKWQMVTSEKPWIFWVDNSGVLWGQIWDEVDTKVEIATSVSKVKAIRGWRNVNMPSVDQGVIAGYIKNDNKLYYRNYCYISSGLYGFEAEREVTNFISAVNLNLFITNDYRVGFIIEDLTGQIQYVLTERAWAGMGFAPSYFQTTAEMKLELKEVEHISLFNREIFEIVPDILLELLYSSDINTFISASNFEDENENFGINVIFDTEQRIILFDPTAFELYDDNNVRFRGMTGSRINDRRFIVQFENFNNAIGDIKIQAIGGMLTNEGGSYYSTFSFIFTPTGLIPEAIDPPEVEVIWNE